MTTPATVTSTSNLPPAARKQVKEANKLIEELNAKPSKKTAAAATDPAAAAEANLPVVEVGSPPAGAKPVAAAPQPEPSELEKANARYNSLQGKYNAETAELRTRLAAAEQTAKTLVEAAAARPAAPAAAPTPMKPEDQFKALGVTEQELSDYGPELIGIVTRVARNMSAGEINGLKQEVAELKRSVGSVGTVMAQNAQQKVFDALNAEFGEEKWSSVNKSDEFVAWLQVPDVFSGASRLEGLKSAFARADAARVVAIFRAFIGNTSSVPAARQPAVDPATLVAPAQGRGGDGEAPGSTGGKIWSEQEINDFYQRARKGKIPAAEIQATEAEIYRAVAEGRVRTAQPHHSNQ